MPLRGTRVLLIEDEYSIALAVETFLKCKGCEVIGPITSLSHSLDAATTSLLDVALLDVDIVGGKSFPIADVLKSRDVPFAFVTGGEVSSIEELYPGRPIISKPCTLNEILGAILMLTRPSDN